MSFAVIAFPEKLPYSVRAFDLNSCVSRAVALASASSEVVDARSGNNWSFALFESPWDSAEVGHLRISLEAGIVARDTSSRLAREMCDIARWGSTGIFPVKRKKLSFL